MDDGCGSLGSVSSLQPLSSTKIHSVLWHAQGTVLGAHEGTVPGGSNVSSALVTLQGWGSCGAVVLDPNTPSPLSFPE